MPSSPEAQFPSPRAHRLRRLLDVAHRVVQRLGRARPQRVLLADELVVFDGDMLVLRNLALELIATIPISVRI